MRKSTTSQQPSTGVRTIGGSRNALDYDYLSDEHLTRLNAGGWSDLGTNGMISIFAVFEYDSQNQGMVHFQNHLSLQYNQIGYQYGSTSYSYADGADSGPSIFNVNLNWDSSASLPDSYINAYVNGSNQVANTAYTTQFPTDQGGFRLTFMSGNDTLDNNDGALGEAVIVMDTSDDTRERMEGYLAHKWNLTANLPADHTWKDAPPIIAEPRGSLFRFR